MISLKLAKKADLDKTLNVFSKVTGFDFTIINSQLKRIVATGAYQKKEMDIMDDLSANIASAHVLNTGESALINHPGDKPCLDCPDIKNCEEKAVIIQPLYLKNSIVAVMAMGAFTSEQNIFFSKNKHELYEFSKEFARLISLKIMDFNSERLLNKHQQEIELFINEISNPAIFIDDKEKVVYTNQNAQDGGASIVPGEKVTQLLSNSKIYSIPICLDGYNQLGTLILLNKSSMLNLPPSQKGLSNFLGVTDFAENLKIRALKAAKSDFNILITGESGTGKEVLAKAIHDESNRNKSKFIAINCSAIPHSLVESEFFGYEDGAFTGARKGGKAGILEAVEGGTLFLDEISEMPLDIQSKFLRALECGYSMRLGSTLEKMLDFRIISATNRNVEEEVKLGRVREDLYFRLNVIPLHITPLRQRKSDIEFLLNYYIRQYSCAMGLKVPSFDGETKKILLNYCWPGNTRELVNAVQYMLTFAEGDSIKKDNLPEKIYLSEVAAKNIPQTLQEVLDETEKIFIVSTMQRSNDFETLGEVANKLGISRATLYRKMKKIGIDRF